MGPPWAMGSLNASSPASSNYAEGGSDPRRSQESAPTFVGDLSLLPIGPACGEGRGGGGGAVTRREAFDNLVAEKRIMKDHLVGCEIFNTLEEAVPKAYTRAKTSKCECLLIKKMNSG